MNILLGLLSNWKVLGGIVVLVFAGAGYWYVQGLQEDTKQLKSELVVEKQKVLNLTSSNESLERQYESLEQSLINYQESLETAQASNRNLQEQLRTKGETDEALQECLNYRLPDDVLNSLSE